MTETAPIQALYDNLTPYRVDGEQVYIVNNADGLRYLTVATAGEQGDAGGDRMTTSEPVRLYPGINRVAKAYSDRVEVDAARQRKRRGGVLADMIDDGTIEFIRDLGKTNPAKVASLLLASANIGLVAELRSHAKHGAAAVKAFEAWHSPEASDATKTLRHFWAMSTGSRKAA